MEEKYDGRGLENRRQEAEHEWRKTKHIHYDIYKAFVVLTTGYSSLDSNTEIINNTCTLFATVNNLTNPSKLIASEILYTEKCNKCQIRHLFKSDIYFCRFVNHKSAKKGKMMQSLKLLRNNCL